MKKLIVICSGLLFLCATLCAETAPGEEKPSAEENVEQAAVKPSAEEIVEQAEEWLPLPHGVRYRVLHEGNGTKAALWASVYLHYRLTAENGTVLRATYTDWDHGGRAHKHVIGSGTLEEALEMVVTTMRERDRRVFKIPAELFNLWDFHTHSEGDDHDDEEHDRVVSALRPGSMLKAEVSLLWVRPYDPTNFNRFRISGD
jgi:hypothetical protein